MSDLLRLLIRRMGADISTIDPLEASFRSTLTERQIACLEGVAQHKTAKQIALELGISYHAVESHLKAARRKLGVSSTAEALELLRHPGRPYYGGEPGPQRTPQPGQYYGSQDLFHGSTLPHADHTGRLDEAAFASFGGRRKRVWEYDYELTPQRTVLLVGVVTVIFIIVLALLVVIGIGVDILASARG